MFRQPDFQFIRNREARINSMGPKEKYRKCTLQDEHDFKSFLKVLEKNEEYTLRFIKEKNNGIFVVFYVVKK